MIGILFGAGIKLRIWLVQDGKHRKIVDGHALKQQEDRQQHHSAFSHYIVIQTVIHSSTLPEYVYLLNDCKYNWVLQYTCMCMAKLS